MDIDLDDARIGCHANDVETRVLRRGIAFKMDRLADFFGRCLSRCDQFEEIFELLNRRQENAKAMLAHFGGDGGTHLALDFADHLLGDVLLLGRCGEAGSGLGARIGFKSGLAAREDFFRIGQGAARHTRVLGHHMRIVSRLQMLERAQWQTIARRTVAGRQEQLATPGFPFFSQPGAGGLGIPALYGQHIAGGMGQAPLEYLGNARARLGVGQFGIGRINIGRQVGFLEQPLAGVFIGLVNGFARQAEIARKSIEELSRVLMRGIGLDALLGDQLFILPHRLAVDAPIE